MLIDTASPIWFNVVMASEQPIKLSIVRQSVSFFGHQHKFIHDIAKRKFEGNFSQAARHLIDKLMAMDLKE